MKQQLKPHSCNKLSEPKHHVYLSLLCLCLVLILPAVSFAQQSGTIDLNDNSDYVPKNNTLIGEVEIEKEEKKVNHYSVNQEAVNQYIQSTIEQMTALASGEKISNTAKPLTEDELLFYAAGYLYCTSKKGSCPFLLDALLATDFLLLCNAKDGACQRPKKVACQNLPRMWKLWIANDFEQRLNHTIPIGLMGVSNDFKQNQFPTYLKCSRTLLEPLKKSLKDETYVQEYASDATRRDALSKTASYLKGIEANIGNIFILQGIQTKQKQKKKGKKK